MNSIISIITALIITVSNLFGFAPVTEFFETLFSVEIFAEENEHAEELPEEPSEEDTESKETIYQEDADINLNASEPAPEPEPVSNVKLVPVDGSTTVIDENKKIITGLREYIQAKDLSDFFVVDGDGYYELEYADELHFGWPGTGTLVKVYDNSDTSEPVAVYTIVIYGDVNGDTYVTAADSTYISNEVDGITNWSETEYKVIAADINRNGVVDAEDAKLVGDASGGFYTIYQNIDEII